MSTQPVTPIVWQSGATASDPIFLGRLSGFNRILFPVGFQGDKVTFQCAPGSNRVTPDAAAFRSMKDAGGTVLSVSSDPTYIVALLPDLLAGLGWFRLLAASAQSVSRTVYLLHPAR